MKRIHANPVVVVGDKERQDSNYIDIITLQQEGSYLEPEQLLASTISEIFSMFIEDELLESARSCYKKKRGSLDLTAKVVKLIDCD